MMYNEINAKYPRKPDLRKCLEFKQWQNSMAIEHGQETVSIRKRKPYKYTRAVYNNIDVNPDSRTVQGKIQQKTMQLNIELMTIPNGNQQETAVQEPGPPASPHESDPPSTPEEQPAEAPIEPYSPFSEIPPDLVEKIMTELRLDPQLSTIMDDVQTEMQESIELNFPELEIDIPELDQIFDQDDIFW